MTYLQWNNAICKSLFNEDKSEQPVYLFTTRQDIIKIGKSLSAELSEEVLFSDFLAAIRCGLPGTPKGGTILEQAQYALTKWRQNPRQIDGIPVESPLYLSYLILFILPLTENHNLTSRVDAYYRPLNSFLQSHSLPTLPLQNENLNWNKLWEDLEDWTIIKKNTELGIFELHPFSNANWVYVGKPLSQCVFPPSALRAIPKLFEIAGMVPGEEYTPDNIRTALTKYGKDQLGLSEKILATIRNTDNELGQSIVNIVKKRLQEWSGITDQYNDNDGAIQKGTTIAQLRLCLEGDKIKGFKSYYRLFTKLDFPEDLTFTFKNQEIKCQHIGNGWSKPIILPLQESIELNDPYNKWKAKFAPKNVRLFIPGANFHLSGWVEVPFLVTTRMLLLVTDHLSPAVEEWGSLFEKNDFEKRPSSGLAAGYNLYELKNPPIGHPDIPALKFRPDSEKIIQLKGGIKVGTRKWIRYLLPEVELENGHGNERLYLRYQEKEDRILLKRKETDQPLWLLPENIEKDNPFCIEIEGVERKGNQLTNCIVSSKKHDYKAEENALPFRDKFGVTTEQIQASSYVQGRRLFGVDERAYYLKQNTYSSKFQPAVTARPPDLQFSPYQHDHNELLLTYLAERGPCTAKDYFEAFDSIYQSRFTPEEIEAHPLELSKIKRLSLNYFDFMGFLDYDYSPKKSSIVVNPPYLILLPTNSGRKAFLGGGRTKATIDQLQQTARGFNLNLSCEMQDPSLVPFLLPRTVTISGFNEDNGYQIIKNIQALADICSIRFDDQKLPQFRLAEYSGNIDEYSKTLSPILNFDDSGWPAKQFDSDRLAFLPVANKSIDKKYSLIEYRLTEYSLRHMLWIDGTPFSINKSWGRYLVLKSQGKHVAFIDKQKNLLAIPASLPLPMLLSEAFTLFSGKAQRQSFLTLDNFATWYTVYENIPAIQAYNYFLKIGQKLKESIIPI